MIYQEVTRGRTLKTFNSGQDGSSRDGRGHEGLAGSGVARSGGAGPGQAGVGKGVDERLVGVARTTEAKVPKCPSGWRRRREPAAKRPAAGLPSTLRPGRAWSQGPAPGTGVAGTGGGQRPGLRLIGQ